MSSEVIEIVESTEGGRDGVRLWTPVEGPEVERMLGRLPTTARNRVREEATEVLSRCLPVGAGTGRRAGLIVGQVQSGKTASFTAVAALARDNRVPLVILIAGTKSNLLEQSRSRLAVDLGLSEPDAHFRWATYKSPQPGSHDVPLIAAHIHEAIESSSGDDHVTVLITVMKNATHMRRLAGVLREIGESVDLTEVTTLVIDDEVDQATPNLKWKAGSESATYSNLREIRESLPRHTLLEYTATPQAPLLVSIADEISPDFTYVLTPGHLYTGGKFFFQERSADFLRVIPVRDLAALEPAHPSPPDSLFAALATFLVGVAIGLVQRDSSGPSQRSMLIHPSQATAPQSQFANWVRQTRDQWVALLDSQEEDRDEWIQDFFEPAYQDLSKTIEKLPERQQVLDKLARAMRLTRIEEVNTSGGSSTVIEWSQAYSWILIGGAMMDRGFTVEGLTVTYMPRPVGVGNADTVQQRARFFGYKKSYAGFCRAWLSTQVADVFASYVEHEESMRRELQQQAASGQSLKQWRRRFLLDRSLRPTRRAVISMLYSHHAWRDSWFQQWHIPLPASANDDADIGSANRRLAESFVSSQEWSVYKPAPDLTDMQTHSETTVPLGRVLEEFLADFVMVEDDAAEFSSLMLGVEELVDRDDEHVWVLNMSQGKTRKRALIADSTRLKGLFQGRSKDRQYPGDRNISDGARLTLQLHWIEAAVDDGSDEGGSPLRSAVPVLAIYVPASLGFSAVVGP